MGNIAVESEPKPVLHSRGAARPAWLELARGKGWFVSDVTCCAGPRDRAFEEQHAHMSIAIVTEGTFQYRSSEGRELMSPGSLLLGNAGQYFECGHEHGTGDHCVSFSYEPDYFEALAEDAGVCATRFRTLRLRPVREMSPLIARACAEAAKPFNSGHAAANESIVALDWEAIGQELAVRALELAAGHKVTAASEPAAEARVTRVLRMIESRPDQDHELGSLAREAKLSRYHFLRVFRQLTGLTPHRYILRARLRRAATRLLLEPAKVLDIALDSGFGDISNFNHAFHAEFGVSPRTYRRNSRQ
ncbi:MAG TPA: AraC family transcriptional regulator [Candidatus Angelobacter sp.]|nr:AraC family transcriptional regulator [Candidatus Angelobacter sp.]